MTALDLLGGICPGSLARNILYEPGSSFAVDQERPSRSRTGVSGNGELLSSRIKGHWHLLQGALVSRLMVDLLRS